MVSEVLRACQNVLLLAHADDAMIQDLSWDDKSLIDWQNLQNLPECDPDSDLTALVPACGRLLGWQAEGQTAEQRGDRVTAMLYCVRPDFVEGRSLRFMSDR